MISSVMNILCTYIIFGLLKASFVAGTVILTQVNFCLNKTMETLIAILFKITLLKIKKKVLALNNYTHKKEKYQDLVILLMLRCFT